MIYTLRQLKETLRTTRTGEEVMRLATELRASPHWSPRWKQKINQRLRRLERPYERDRAPRALRRSSPRGILSASATYLTQEQAERLSDAIGEAMLYPDEG